MHFYIAIDNDWPAYAKAFGWVSMERIRDVESCAKYVVKYITKQQQTSAIGLNNHLYYCSKGLNRAEEIYRGDVRRGFIPDYENDYVKCKHYDTLEEAIQIFCDEDMEE